MSNIESEGNQPTQGNPSNSPEYQAREETGEELDEEERKVSREGRVSADFLQAAIESIENREKRRIVALGPWEDYQNIDGRLNGRVRFEDSSGPLPVINGQLVEEINGRRITDCSEVQNIDGRLNGEVWFEGESEVMLEDERGIMHHIVLGQIVD